MEDRRIIMRPLVNLTRRDFVLHSSIAGLVASLVSSQPLWAQAGRGKKYAVIVGVKDYDPEELSPLRFTARDAEALAGQLTRLQFDVSLMTGAATRPQLKPNSADKIERVLKNRAAGLTADDTLIFAFMGHGVQFASDKAGSNQKDEVQELYFCPEDAKLGDRNTLLSMDKVYDALGGSQAGRKLLLVDACRNDPQPLGKRRGKETELEPVGRAIRTVPKGMLAIFSCSESESSREYPDLDMGYGQGHGVFTYHVLKYLHGDANETFYPQQQLTVTDLAHYVGRETKDFVWNKDNKDQIPIPYGKLAPWSLGSAPSGKRPLERMFRSKSTGMEMMLLPAGTFTMGSPVGELERSEDESQHKVSISRPFYMGKYEVTQAEFQRVLGFNPSHFTDSTRLPVESVSWFDAVSFCNKLGELDGFQPCYRIMQIEKDGNSIKSAQVGINKGVAGYRLPTEAEWEYACRAGTTTPFHFGANITASQVNFNGNYPYNNATKGIYREKTVEVDSLSGNAWGLHHMHGNVWEWCQDYYGDYERAVAIDPGGATEKDGSYRVNRGGSWGDIARGCRSAFRSRCSPDYRGDYLGFRVSLVPTGK